MDIALSDCLKGDSSALETLEVEADGQRQPAFNARERAHMRGLPAAVRAFAVGAAWTIPDSRPWALLVAAVLLFALHAARQTPV